MQKNTIIWIIVVIIIIILGAVFMGNGVDEDQLIDESTSDSTTDNSGSIAAENEINVNDQKAGIAIVTVSFVSTNSRGYVAVYEAVNGQPGKFLGASSLLLAGSTSDVSLPVSEALAEGKIYIAMLHIDNGDETFSVATDPFAKNSFGNTVMAEFKASADASLGN